MNPEGLDINVHPAKTEVRFRDPRALHQFIFHAISKSLASPHKKSTTNNSVAALQGEIASSSPAYIKQSVMRLGKESGLLLFIRICLVQELNHNLHLLRPLNKHKKKFHH